ncbi:MAG: acetylxylan esterase [Terrimicrobiaceae bacterium]
MEELFRVQAPEGPADFDVFWQRRHARALSIDHGSKMIDTGREKSGWRVFDWAYQSTDGVLIRGWVLQPANNRAVRALVIGHGYGGRTEPDFDLPYENAVLAFPCARGLGKSLHPCLSPDSRWHVLHHIHSREDYVLGGCVDDTWLAVSALLSHFPECEGRVGYTGSSFGGGIGVLALASDQRVARAHLHVPSFGNHPLRLRLPSVGSAASVQAFLPQCPSLIGVLAYYDAAVAARRVHIPVHCACAMFDPAVAPAGQFSIFNALSGKKELFVLSAGHHVHPGQRDEELRLRQDLKKFFRDL